MRMPPVTLGLLIAIIAMFLAQQSLPAATFLPFELWPWGEFSGPVYRGGPMITVGFQPWQLVTHAFLHGGWAHLLFNGFALYQFGGAVENAIGSKRFAFYYFFCVVGAGLCQLVVTTMMLDGVDPQPIATVGASGGIFGLLLAFAVFYPGAKLVFLLIPVPVPAKIAVTIYGAIELYLGLSGAQSGVAHFAHLGGLLFGWLLIQYWRRRRPTAPGTLV
jgi:membrane associated rhomboid family serine protease